MFALVLVVFYIQSMNTTKTVRQSLARAAVKALVVYCLVAAAFVFVTNAEPLKAAERPLAVGSPAQLVSEHDCWLGAAPADMEGKMPSHVVVTMKTDVAPIYTADAGTVADALGRVFGGKSHGIYKVHGFCR